MRRNSKSKRGTKIGWVAYIENKQFAKSQALGKWLKVGFLFDFRLQADQFLKKHYPTHRSRVVGARVNLEPTGYTKE